MKNALAILGSASFYTLIEESAVGVYIFHNNRFLYVNRKFLEMFGYKREEIMDMSPYELIHREDHHKVLANITNRKINEKKNYIIRAIKKDDTIINVELYSSKIYLENIEEPVIIGKAIDITKHVKKQQKQIEAINELKQQNEEIELSIKNLQDIKEALNISAIVAITDASGMITQVNDNFTKISKFSREELIGQNHRILNSGYHSKEFFKDLWKTISSGHVWRGEIRNRAKDGSLYWVDTAIVPLVNESGKPYQYVSIRFEISDKQDIKTKLLETNRRLKEAQSIAKLGSWEYDVKKDETYWSEELYHIFGIDPDNPIKISFSLFLSFVHRDDIKHVKDTFQSVVAGEKKDADIQFRIIRNGSIVYLSTQYSAKYDQTGDLIYLTGTNQDITETKKLEQEIRIREERFKSLIQYSYDVLGIFDKDGTITYESPAIEKLFGYKVEDVVGKNAFDFVHPEDIQIGENHFNDCLAHPRKPFKEILRLKKADGSWRYCEAIFANYIDDPSINGIIVNLSDVSEIIETKEKIEYMAYHDALTDIDNRRSFEAYLSKEFEQASKSNELLGLMLLDLDRFKHVNDTLGHYAGDELIRQVARKLKNCIGERGFVARLGGDEFVVVISQTTVDALMKIATEILELFNSPFQINGYEFYITTSIGISIYPDGADDTETLIKNADIAMYRAKETGKNKFNIFRKTVNNQKLRSFTLSTDLRKALDRNEFILHFQPRVDSQTNKVIAAEALIRWIHPDLGFISPGEFIPLAEETGLIVPISEWVFWNACKQIKEWQDQGYTPIKVSVNFSPVQFLRGDLIDNIKEMISQIKIDPKWLEIEITESTLMGNEIEVFNVISELKGMGIKVALDDFGTGYSALSYLKKYKVNTLKIDRSFIIDLPIEKDSREIACAIITLAQNLDMIVVAEGVETEEQLSILKEMNCNEIQGYYYSKPVTKEEFEVFFKQGNYTLLRGDH